MQIIEFQRVAAAVPDQNDDIRSVVVNVVDRSITGAKWRFV
jgi:hypothetical protein